MNDKWPEHGKWVIGFRRDLNLYRVCQVNRHERIVVSKLLRTVSDDTFEVDIVPDAFSIDYWIHQYQVL